MKRFVSTLFAVALCAVLVSPVWAQEEKNANAPAQEAKAKLSEEDIKAFQPLLNEYMNAEKGGAQTEAMNVLLKAMEDYSEKKKVSSPVADADAWLKMFGAYNDGIFAKRKVYATGRLKTESYIHSKNGEHYLYEYSFYVPKDYDPTKSWPVLLCLHDKDAKKMGQGYIKGLWQGSKESKLLADQFIIVAPHIPAKLQKKKTKIKDRSGKSQRIETTSAHVKWMQTHHLLSIIMPLNEIRKAYNCDPARIFIEGVGEGADAATTLAAISNGRFAGLISRHGKLRDAELLTGLQDTPSLFVIRDGGEFATGKGKDFVKQLEAATEGESKMESLKIMKLTSIGKKKLPMKLMANQKVDPGAEANAEVAKFVLANKLDPHPKSIRITSNHRAFKHHGLIKVTSNDIAAGKTLDCIATFDREKNTVELTGANFYGVSLFLNDNVLDLSKPVQVLVNGRTVDARVADRSPAKMLKKFYADRSNFNQIQTCVIVVPGFSLEEEKKEDDKKKDGDDATDDKAAKGSKEKTKN